MHIEETRSHKADCEPNSSVPRPNSNHYLRNWKKLHRPVLSIAYKFNLMTHRILHSQDEKSWHGSCKKVFIQQVLNLDILHPITRALSRISQFHLPNDYSKTSRRICHHWRNEWIWSSVALQAQYSPNLAYGTTCGFWYCWLPEQSWHISVSLRASDVMWLQWASFQLLPTLMSWKKLLQCCHSKQRWWPQLNLVVILWHML